MKNVQVPRLTICYRIWNPRDKTRRGLLVPIENSTIRARGPLTHLLDGGVVDGGESGGLGRVRRVAECLGILETGHEGAIAREQAVVLPALPGSRGNLTVQPTRQQVWKGVHAVGRTQGTNLAPLSK